MANLIINGDYVKREDLMQIEGIEELLQNIKIVLRTSKGAFYPDKNFGSRINGISNVPIDEYAAAFAREALDGIDGVCVKAAHYQDNSLTVNLLINDEERQVSVNYEDYI